MARLYLSIALMGLLFPCMAQQQSLLSTAGGFHQNSEISVSWSLGETVTETYSTENYTFTQGFQQSKLIPVGIIDKKNPVAFSIEVFPNPTQGLVFIKLNKDLLNTADIPDHYTLFNIQGKQLTQGQIPEEPLILDLNTYSGAVYYLRLYKSNSNIQSTVIIQKIN